jgi:hypothetical protein
MTRLLSRAIDSTVLHVYKQAIGYSVAPSLTWLFSQTNPVVFHTLKGVLCPPKSSSPLVSILALCLER